MWRRSPRNYREEGKSITALRDLVRPICRVATLLASAAVANAQQVDDLRQQLEQLKQEYQHKIQEMEKRIGDLETQKSSPAVAVIDENAIAEEVKNDVKGLISSQPGALQGQLPSEPTYDLFAGGGYQNPKTGGAGKSI